MKKVFATLGFAWGASALKCKTGTDTYVDGCHMCFNMLLKSVKVADENLSMCVTEEEWKTNAFKSVPPSGTCEDLLTIT